MFNLRSTNAYGNRSKAYRILAKKSQDEETKKEYTALAEANEKKFAELNDSNSTKS